jgi:hypothetical protein
MDFANEEHSQGVFLILQQKNLKKTAVACVRSTRVIRETRKGKRTISSRISFPYNVKRRKRRKTKQNNGSKNMPSKKST